MTPRHLATFLIILLCSCAGEPDRRAAHVPAATSAPAAGQAIISPAEFFPVSADARWQYDVTMTVQGKTARGTMVREVVDRARLNDARYYEVKTTYTGIPGQKSETSFLRIGETGVRMIDAADPELEPVTEVPFPLELGQTWTTRTADALRRSRAAALADIRAGGRRYENCLQISFEAIPKRAGAVILRVDSFYARGVGLVKRIARSQQPQIRIEMVLQSQ